MKNPPHPGDLIRTWITEALGLNVSRAAEIHLRMQLAYGRGGDAAALPRGPLHRDDDLLFYEDGTVEIRLTAREQSRCFSFPVVRLSGASGRPSRRACL